MPTAIKTLLLATALLLARSAWAFSVFACEPEWGALVKAIYPKAEVFSATTMLQDPHHIEARPSLIARLRSADFAVCTGAGLEAGWLPVLQARAGNSRVQDGAPSMFYAAQAVTLIDPVRAIPSPLTGDVHSQGNPHVHLDPHRLLQIARSLRDRLIQLRPAEAAQITLDHQRFEVDFSQRIQGWERIAEPLRGRSVMTQHASFGYLWAWLQIKTAADLEPRPGMAPTPGHLERLKRQLGRAPVAAIVIAQHHDRRPAEWLIRQAEGRPIPLLVLPATVSETSAQGLVSLFDGLVATLRQQIQD